MKERHWTSLVVSLQHGQCVLLLGPEIPAGSAEPGALSADGASVGSSLADALSQFLASQLRDESLPVYGTTLAAIAQQYEDSPGFGPSDLQSSSARFCAATPLLPSSVHQALAELPFSLVVTTCHDDLFARALERAGKTPSIYRYSFRGDQRENPEIALPYSCATPAVYHLFGHHQEPTSLVLSENNLLDFLVAVVSGRPQLPDTLRRALLKPGQSLLFLGFGIKHWYLRVLLKILVRILGLNRAGAAFALEPLHTLATAEREQTVLFYQRGIRIEVVDSAIGDFLQELRQRFESAGGFLGTSALPAGAPRVFISYASEDVGVARRLSEGLRKAYFDPWLDDTGLPGGVDWDHAIKDQLRTTDYVLVLHSRSLARKTDSYVNKELSQALERGQNVRGTFLIPLLIDDLPESEWVPELARLQQLSLSPQNFAGDLAQITKTIARDFQRRNR